MSGPPQPRLRRLDAIGVAKAAVAPEGPSDAELLDRLEQALGALPAAERSAAVVAFGLAEGTAGVAQTQDLDPEEAEALARSALQLLRAAMADLQPAREPSPFPRLAPRRHRMTPLD